MSLRKKLLSLSIFFFFFLLISCEKTSICEKYIYSMDTVIHVTLYNADSIHLQEVKSIYDDYHKLSDSFNEYQGVNNIYTINNSTEKVKVDERLVDLLNYCLNMNSEINNNFNILIGGVTKLWKDALQANVPFIPVEKDILEQIEIMKNSKLLIENDYVKIEGQAKIDLGGVAKGYATEQVYKYLKDNGISSYLINAGNSNVLLGYKNKKDNFTVGLKNINNTDYYKVLNVNNKAIVTSSIAEQYVMINGTRYHHIIDAKTGYPVKQYDIVTLIGNDSAFLDILSTALFTMTLEDIKRFLQDKDIEIIIVKDDLIIYQSDGVNDYA